jgi:DNA-binding Lrp family transcriptional regulator
MSEAPEVQQCYYVTGEADFMLVVVVPTLQEYEALTQRLFFGDPNIRRFRSFVVMNRVKASLALSLPSA